VAIVRDTCETLFTKLLRQVWGQTDCLLTTD
jgi:hypothetical protein